MKKFILILIISSLMSSCGLYTKYSPVSETPDGLYGQNLLNTDSVSNLATVGWRDFFSDSVLIGLIERGLTNNTDLNIAESRVKEAEATLMSAKLSYLPSFSLSPQGSVSSFNGAKASYMYSLPVTANWEIDLFGKVRNSKMQASALLEQSRDYRQVVQTQLIASIANTYYTLMMLDEQLSISIDSEKSYKESVTTLRALMNAGRSSDAAVSQMEASWLQVQGSILDLKEQIHIVENSLALLLAETPHSYSRECVNSSDILSAFRNHNTKLSIGIPLQLLSNRPDVRSAQHSLEAAFYGVNMSRAAFYPSITLGGNIGWTNSAGTIVTNPAKFLASALASITQPLFERGKLKAQLQISKEREEQARLSFQQTLLNAGVEVNDALTSYQTSIEKSAVLDEQVEALKRAYNSTSLLMEYSDNTTYLEVLTAQQSLLAAQLSQTANRFAAVQNLISLYHALGGGAN